MSGKLRLFLVMACAIGAVSGPTASASVIGPWLPGDAPDDISYPASDVPKVAASGSGSATIVWPQDFSGTSRIQSATRAAGGTSFAVDSQPISSVSSTSPEVAIAPDGATTVVWLQNDYSEILVSTRSAGGASFSTPEVLGSAAAYQIFGPQVAIGPDGTTTVTWKLDDGGGNYSLKARTRGPGSSTFDAEETLSGSDSVLYHRIAAGPDGTVVMWTDISSGALRVRSRPGSSASSSGFDSAQTLAASGAGSISIAQGTDGVTTAAWDTSTAVGNATRPAGSSASSAFAGGTPISAPAGPYDVSIAAGPGGAAAVTWGENNLVYQASRAPGSGSFTSAQDLSAANPGWGTAYQARVAYAADGKATVAWYQNSSATSKDIVLATSRAAGATAFDLSAVDDISTGASPSSNNSNYPEIAVGGDGSFDVAWITYRGAGDLIQARWSQALFRNLSVSKTGSGSGTVTSSPAGIDCGVTCSARFDAGSEVTLTAAAAAGSTFTGWSDGCSGTATTCTVTMSQARSVNAGFSADSPPTPPPSNAFTQGVSRVGPGRVETTVRVPGAGRITQGATRRSHGRTVSACRAVTRRPTAAGRYRLVCVLNRATRAARRHGAVRIQLRTTYTPSGGTPRTRLRALVLPSLKPHYTG